MEPDELVALGVVVKPHGVRGELRVHPYSDSGILLEVRELVIRAPDGLCDVVTIAAARKGPKGLLFRFEGCDHVDDAEALRGHELCLPRAALPEPEEDEVYFVDVLGLRVVDEAGVEHGTVEDIVTYPSMSCLLVAGSEGRREVPWTEPWVLAVDREAGVVRVGDLSDVPLVPPRGGRR